MRTPKLNFATTVSLSATVSLLDYARRIGLDFSYETMCTITGQLERMRYVDAVEDRHQFWVRLELYTSRPDVAARRIAAVLIKIERLLLKHRELGEAN